MKVVAGRNPISFGFCQVLIIAVSLSAIGRRTLERDGHGASLLKGRSGYLRGVPRGTARFRYRLILIRNF